MAVSQNGWPVLDTRPPMISVPGVKSKFAVRSGDVATVFAELITRFHAEVEDLNLYTAGDEWGWAVRTVRGSRSVISNHASGTAIDLNATRHPRGVKNTFTNDQKRRMRTILAAFFDAELGRPVLRWGEDFSTTVDGMHVEINAGVAPVRRVAERIRAKHAPTPTPRITKEKPVVQTPSEFADAVWGWRKIPNRNAPKDSRNPMWTPSTMLSNIEHTQDKHTEALNQIALRLARIEDLLRKNAK